MSSTRAKSPAQHAPAESTIPAGRNGAPLQETALKTPSAAMQTTVTDVSLRLENFLIDVADTLNSTLETDKLLGRVAELVRQVIDYEIFAILLLNERAQELRIRFQIGHTPETERLKIKVGEGITGMAVERRSSVLVEDVSNESRYINAIPIVRSALAVLLIAKTRVKCVLVIKSSRK